MNDPAPETVAGFFGVSQETITFVNITAHPMEFSRGGFLVPPGGQKTVDADRYWKAWTEWLAKEGRIRLTPAKSVDAAAPKRPRKTSPAPSGASAPARKKRATRSKLTPKKDQKQC